MPKTRTVQGITFNSGKDLREHIQTINKKYKRYDYANPADYEFLMEVLRDHTSIDRKLHCNSPKLQWNIAKGGTMCWHFDCGQGSTVSISPEKVIKKWFGRKPADLKLIDFQQAARAAVQPQIDSFRRQVRSRDRIFSELSGVEVEPDEFVVDHKHPFDTLLFDFAMSEGIAYRKVAITRINGGGVQFSDQELKDEWASYHKQHAVLRAITKEENLKLPKPSNDWASLA